MRLLFYCPLLFYCLCSSTKDACAFSTLVMESLLLWTLRFQQNGHAITGYLTAYVRMALFAISTQRFRRMRPPKFLSTSTLVLILSKSNLNLMGKSFPANFLGFHLKWKKEDRGIFSHAMPRDSILGESTI